MVSAVLWALLEGEGFEDMGGQLFYFLVLAAHGGKTIIDMVVM